MNGLQYTPFSRSHQHKVGRVWKHLFAPWNRVVKPEFEGMQHIPKQGPVLFVGNHSILAFADAVLMFRQLFIEHGIVVRSLGQHEHFKIPGWGSLLAWNGAVDGTRANCTAMMAAGEYIVVYPGGGGEVMKRKGEQHTLRWKQRTGFARMAIENDCTIVPFSTVGADDCYDIHLDNADMARSRLGRFLIKLSGLKQEEFPPVVSGLGFTLLPKPQKMFFRFHPPIAVAEYKGSDIEQAARALRDRVEGLVQSGLNELQQKRG